MEGYRILAGILLIAAGCSPIGSDTQKANVNSGQESDATGPQELPARITNQFGMTFCLVEVDPSRSDHQSSFPSSSYYLQETELQGDQHQAFRMAAFGDGKFETIDWHFNGGFPSEWREVFHYSEALSKFDTEYDYRLPSQKEWAFACKNGYDQTCPGKGAESTIDSTESSRPNKYGISGFMNYDAECADEPGLFLGKLDNWAGAYEHREKPKCRCDQYTRGNPDADDGLNELIVARFVLVPEGMSKTKANDKNGRGEAKRFR